MIAEPGPHAAELPKEETEAAAFVRANPSLDGRGIVVGIMDTGIDPRAPGLQTTTDSKPKVVDLVDCTGSGDVDTSTTAAVSPEGSLRGLSGRSLSVPKSWPPCPSGRYHLGLKAAFDLYPRGLAGRVKDERKKASAEAQAQAYSSAQAAAVAAGDKAGDKEADEARARVALLERLDRELEDTGPFYDVVAFADDGGVWRVCVDTSERGDLAACELLRPYRIAQETGTLGTEAALTFSVDVFGDGDVTNICVDAGAHGTHVAGIVAGHFPDRPQLNGVAPGAQVVGLKIGDTRLGSMETGTALVRALTAALDRGCHVVNLSYGEFSSVDNYGHFVTMAEAAVHQKGLIFVTSAGNSGPALTTGGAPGNADFAITVGAFASSAMMGPQYSLRDRLPDIQYTWSSRGPTADGSLGVTVSAPGAAIAPVPAWTHQGRQLMNGTSMASPNACGGVALLLCAMRARGTDWTPALIKRALENSARVVPNATGGAVDRWALGWGLVQVARADAWLRAHEHRPTAAMRLSISATVHGDAAASASSQAHHALTSTGGARGIYLREPCHATKAVIASAGVSPELPDSATAEERIAVDLSVSLRPSAPWVSCAPSLALCHGGKRFELKVDTEALGPGAHLAWVEGVDSSCEELGPIFRLPVSVVRPHVDLRTPEAGATARFDKLRLAPGQVERRFIWPPEGATWACITLSARAAPGEPAASTPAIFMVHAVQLLPQVAVGKTETVARVQLPLASGSAPAAEHQKSMAITGGAALEVTVAQWWSSLTPSEASLEVEFFGVRPAVSRAAVDGRNFYTTVELSAEFRRALVDVEAQVTHLRRSISPAQSKVIPPPAPVAGAPGRGDTTPCGTKLCDLLLRYNVTLKEPVDGLRVHFPALSAQLYESPYGAQLWALRDKAGRVLKWGDYCARAPERLTRAVPTATTDGRLPMTPRSCLPHRRR